MLLPRQADELARSATDRAAGIVKRCTSCGRSFTREQWTALPLVGTFEGVEMRNCPACDSTIGIEVHP